MSTHLGYLGPPLFGSLFEYMFSFIGVLILEACENREVVVGI
jgi:hypothetical protein